MIPARQSLGLRALFAICAFLIATTSSHVIFQRVSTGSDENSYIFQAYNFLDGHIVRPAPPLPEQFAQDMIITRANDGWFSRYPPGHTLWLLTSLWADTVYPAVGLAAAIAVWFLCGAAVALGISQALVAIPLLASPFFCFMYGTHLSHTSGLAAVAILCWGYIRARQRDERWPMLVAGLAWGLLFLNRTYTALLIAVPFGLDALWCWAKTRTLRAFQQAALFAAAASAGIFAYLLYNKLATGDAFQATYLFYEPSEGLGFGPRRTQGSVVNHTPAVGLATLRDNIVRLNQWLWGFQGSLLVLAVLSLISWSRRWSLLLFASVLSVWVGYVAFWFSGVTAAGGPIYYFETLVPLILMAAFGIQRLWNLGAAKPRVRGAVAIILTLVFLANSAGFIAKADPEQRAVQRKHRAIIDTLRSLPPRSMVFVENFRIPYIGGMAFNPHGLQSDPLMLRTMHGDNPVAMRLFPDRRAFLLNGDNPTKPIPLTAPAAIHIERRADKFLKKTGQNKAVGPNEVVRIANTNNAPGFLAFGRSLKLPAGTWRVVWHGDFADILEKTPLDADLVTDADRRTLWADFTFGSQTGILLQAELTVTNVITPVEPRLRYGGSGELQFTRVTFDEIP